MTDMTPPGSNYAAPATSTTEPLSMRQAASLIGEQRRAAEASPEPAPREDAGHDPSHPVQERSDRDERGRFARAEREAQDTGEEPVDAAPADEQVPGEQETAKDDPAPSDDEPSIDPPRSWTKDDKELFKTLPRDLQERIVERERARETEFRRGQNEIAQHRKAVEAERQAVEQARQQYESALPHLLQALQTQFAGEFQDVKTWDDVRKMAEEDPLRYMKWDAEQKRLQRVQYEAQAAQQRQLQENRDRFARWSVEQDQAFIEMAPEFADPTKGAKASEAAQTYLVETIGIPADELTRLWNGEKMFSLRSKEAQLIIRDAVKWRAAQAEAKKAVAKPLPPVQRPGVAPARNESRAAEIETLTRNLESAKGTVGKLAAGAALLKAQRAQSARKGAQGT